MPGLFPLKRLNAASATVAVERWAANGDGRLIEGFVRWFFGPAVTTFDDLGAAARLKKRLRPLLEELAPSLGSSELDLFLSRSFPPDVVAAVRDWQDEPDPWLLQWVCDATTRTSARKVVSATELEAELAPASKIAETLWVIDPYFFSMRNDDARAEFLRWVASIDAFPRLSGVSVLAGLGPLPNGVPTRSEVDTRRQEFEASLRSSGRRDFRPKVQFAERKGFHDRLVAFDTVCDPAADLSCPVPRGHRLAVQVGYGLYAWKNDEAVPTVVSRVPGETFSDIWRTIQSRSGLMANASE
jgi:hypothetical protein